MLHENGLTKKKTPCNKENQLKHTCNKKNEQEQNIYHQKKHHSKCALVSGEEKTVFSSTEHTLAVNANSSTKKSKTYTQLYPRKQVKLQAKSNNVNETPKNTV